MHFRFPYNLEQDFALTVASPRSLRYPHHFRMAPLASSRRATAFFRSRLVHFRSQYVQTPGLFLADWREEKLSWTQTVLRYLLYNVRHGKPSPLGMSKLPFELLDMIFRVLCGKEVHAVRLVCRDWEVASRPFFAERHLKRSLFWLTVADLVRLESLARRFGPYMLEIYIATDHFTISGLQQVWRKYKAHRDYLRNLQEAVADGGGEALLRTADTNAERAGIETQAVGFVARPLHDKGKLGSEYFRHAYQQHRALSPWDRTLRLWPFIWHFLCNIVTQTLLRITGFDRRKLARIAGTMPNGRLEAARVSYAAERAERQ